MPIISSSTLRRLAAAPRCGRSVADALRPTEIRAMISTRPSTFTIPLRSSSGSVLAGAQSQKHLLSEFVGVRGPVAEEVRKIAHESLEGSSTTTKCLERCSLSAPEGSWNSCREIQVLHYPSRYNFGNTRISAA